MLVSIFLDGGADSLSLLFPHGDPDYRRLRPQLALPDSGLVFPEDTRLRWHPSAASFHTLHGEGKLSVLPAVGYTDADQSHFTSRHYWEVGDTDPGLQTGWLGRYLDRVGTMDNPLQGVSLDGDLSPFARDGQEARRGAERRRRLLVLGARRLGPGRGAHAGRGRDARRDARPRPGARQREGRHLAVEPPARAARAVQHGRRFPTARFPYPKSESGFPDQLAGLAAMLAAGLPLHCVALSAYGMYDTHSEQADTLAEGLKLTSDTLLAFQRDLEARGLADRVLTLVWSEFGRRAEENGSEAPTTAPPGSAS